MGIFGRITISDGLKTLFSCHSSGEYQTLSRRLEGLISAQRRQYIEVASYLKYTVEA